ncbi:MAG TPA: TonB-dependent receptor [Gemmatimonadales bacterium]|nr:TonB-dependent receptor [Gemmatimonadales bacterium]
MRLSLVSSVLLVPPLLAAQQPARDTVIEVAPIVVTAERTPLPAAAVSSSVTVLQGDELRARGVRTLADALQEVPAASVVTTGSTGAQTSLFLRGGESDYVKVLVDGVPVNQPGGAFNFNALTLDNVERIEVLRGPASVLYGTDAVTGVVQVFTREGRGPLAVDAAVRGGSYGARRGELAVAGGGVRAGGALSVAQDRTDGIYAFNNRWRNTTASARGRWWATERTQLRGGVRWGEDTYHYPTDGGGAPVDSNTANSHAALTADLGADHQLSGALTLSLLASLDREVNGSRNDPDSPGDTVGYGYASRSEALVVRRSADVRVRYAPATRWSLTGGVEVVRDREDRRPGYAVSNFGAGADTSFSAAERHDRGNTGLYVQALGQPGAWALSAGGRVDHSDGFGDFVTGRLGVVRHLGRSLRLRASLGTAFKAPTLEESYGNSAYSIGDPGLRPERSRMWETGVEHELVPGHLQVSAVWFDQRFRDLVQYAFVSDSEPTYYNVAAATARGLELSLAATPVAGLRLGGSYTFLHTEVTDPGFSTGSGDVFVRGKELIRRPARSGRASASWTGPGRLALTGEVRFTGRRTDVDFGPFPSVRRELPGYTVVDLSADLVLLRPAAGAQGATLAGTLRVENAFDEAYESVVGFPGRGRALLGGVRLHW